MQFTVDFFLPLNTKLAHVAAMNAEPEAEPEEESESLESDGTSGFDSTAPEGRSDASSADDLSQPRPEDGHSRDHEECVPPSLGARRVKRPVTTEVMGSVTMTYPDTPRLQTYEPPVAGATDSDRTGEEGRRSESVSTQTVTPPPSSASAHSLDETCGGPLDTSTEGDTSSSDPLADENNSRDGGHPSRPERQDTVSSSVSSSASVASDGQLSLEMDAACGTLKYEAKGVGSGDMRRCSEDATGIARDMLKMQLAKMSSSPALSQLQDNTIMPPSKSNIITNKPNSGDNNKGL